MIDYQQAAETLHALAMQHKLPTTQAGMNALVGVLGPPPARVVKLLLGRAAVAAEDYIIHANPCPPSS